MCVIRGRVLNEGTVRLNGGGGVLVVTYYGPHI